MITLLLATANLGKIREFREAFSSIPIFAFTTLREMGIQEQGIEDGATFLENARLKAWSLHRKSGFAHVVAEDSGLEVDALGGQPGILSARYAGPAASDAENIAKLLREMEGKSDRSARFVSVVVAIFSGKEELSFRGEVEGTILGQPRGSGGFGYDPVFFYTPQQKSFAELSLVEKNAISHRARSLAALKEHLLQRYGRPE